MAQGPGPGRGKYLGVYLSSFPKAAPPQEPSCQDSLCWQWPWGQEYGHKPILCLDLDDSEPRTQQSQGKDSSSLILF
jgi:hypothetical protein